MCHKATGLGFSSGLYWTNTAVKVPTGTGEPHMDGVELGYATTAGKKTSGKGITVSLLLPLWFFDSLLRLWL